MLLVLESFRDYVTVETLEGDNRYDAGPHGLQVNCNSTGSYGRTQKFVLLGAKSDEFGAKLH